VKYQITKLSCYVPIVPWNLGIGIGIAIGAISSFAVTTLLILCFILPKLKSKAPLTPTIGEQFLRAYLTIIVCTVNATCRLHVSYEQNIFHFQCESASQWVRESVRTLTSTCTYLTVKYPIFHVASACPGWTC